MFKQTPLLFRMSVHVSTMSALRFEMSAQSGTMAAHIVPENTRCFSFTTAKMQVKVAPQEWFPHKLKPIKSI